jgi:hypothetical protein
MWLDPPPKKNKIKYSADTFSHFPPNTVLLAIFCKIFHGNLPNNIEDAYSRECAGVDERGEGESDPVPQLLLVAQAQLTLVVDLRPAIVILLLICILGVS